MKNIRPLLGKLIRIGLIAGGIAVSAPNGYASSSEASLQETPYGYVYNGPHREGWINFHLAMEGETKRTPLILREIPQEPISEIEDIVPYLQILPSREEREAHRNAIPEGIYKTKPNGPWVTLVKFFQDASKYENGIYLLYGAGYHVDGSRFPLMRTFACTLRQ